MHDDAMKQLRSDRRLTGRRGWMAPEELARELARLPDVHNPLVKKRKLYAV